MQAVELTLCPIDVLLVPFSYKQDILLAVVLVAAISLTTTNTTKLGRFKKTKKKKNSPNPKIGLFWTSSRISYINSAIKSVHSAPKHTVLVQPFF